MKKALGKIGLNRKEPVEAQGLANWDYETFDAEKYGLPELDSMSLTELLLELFSDIQEGKRLRHGFKDALLEHGPFFAVRSSLKRLPYRITGLINSIAPRTDETTLSPEDKTLEDAAMKDTGFFVQKRHPGFVGSLASRISGIDCNDLPLWITHNLTQAVDHNSIEAFADLREIAQRVHEKKYPELASSIHDYVRESANGRANQEKGSQLLRDVVKFITLGGDSRVTEFAQLLSAMNSSTSSRRYDDLEHILHRTGRRVKAAEAKEGEDALSGVYRKSIFERVDEGLHNVTKIAPAIVALAAAAGLGFLGYNCIGDLIRDKYDSEDIDRTSYAVSDGRMPPQLSGLGNTGFVVVGAGDLSSAMDKGYSAARVGGLPLDFSLMRRELTGDISKAINDVDALLREYNYPGLKLAMEEISAGGSEVRASISHDHHTEKHIVCLPKISTSVDSDGNLHTTTTIECDPVFDWRDDYWYVDHPRGRNGMNALKNGFLETRANENGLYVFQLNLPSFSEQNFDNTGNDTLRTYNEMVARLAQLPGMIDNFDGKWEGIPDRHTSRTILCDCRQHWEPEDMVGAIGDASQSIVSNLNATLGHLVSYKAALSTCMSHLKGKEDLPANKIFSKYMGDCSTNILRAFGYPPGKGHLFAEEIENLVRIWRYGLGFSGVVAAGIALYFYENGLAGRRYSEYMGN